MSVGLIAASMGAQQVEAQFWVPKTAHPGASRIPFLLLAFSAAARSRQLRQRITDFEEKARGLGRELLIGPESGASKVGSPGLSH